MTAAYITTCALYKRVLYAARISRPLGRKDIMKTTFHASNLVCAFDLANVIALLLFTIQFLLLINLKLQLVVRGQLPDHEELQY
jgi:hypothetical protein